MNVRGFWDQSGKLFSKCLKMMASLLFCPFSQYPYTETFAHSPLAAGPWGRGSVPASHEPMGWCERRTRREPVVGRKLNGPARVAQQAAPEAQHCAAEGSWDNSLFLLQTLSESHWGSTAGLQWNDAKPHCHHTLPASCLCTVMPSLQAQLCHTALHLAQERDVHTGGYCGSAARGHFFMNLHV